jgi:AraC-like DNA-binding protein
MPAGLRYSAIAPPPELAPWIESLWELRAGEQVPGASRLLPDGCVDVVVHLGAAPAWDSVETRAGALPRSYVVGTLLRDIVFQLAPDAHAVGACIRPGAVHAVLGVPADAVAGRVLALGATWEAHQVTALEDAVLAAGPEDAVAALTDRLRRRLAVTAPPDRLVTRVAEQLRGALSGSGFPGITALAEEHTLSVRQLERRFATHVGLSPRLFARVARFDRVARHVRAGRSTAWCDVAARFGYHDQAHLIREFRDFAGRTPGAFEAEAAMSDPYNTDGGEGRSIPR